MNGYKTIGAIVTSAYLAIVPSMTYAADTIKGAVVEGAKKVVADKYKDEGDIGFLGELVEKGFTGIVGGIMLGTYRGGRAVNHRLQKEPGIQALNAKMHRLTKDGRIEHRITVASDNNEQLKSVTNDLYARLGALPKKAAAPSGPAKPAASGDAAVAAQLAALAKELKK